MMNETTPPGLGGPSIWRRASGRSRRPVLHRLYLPVPRRNSGWSTRHIFPNEEPHRRAGYCVPRI